MKMKKKTVLGTFLMLSLLAVTVVATIAPTLGRNPTKNPAKKVYGAVGQVVLQLPSNASPPASPGTPNHPAILQIVAFDDNRRSFGGEADELIIFMWNPVSNRFEPVAIITDNAKNAEFWKTAWNNTYVWYQAPGFVLFPNIILVEPQTLEVWTESMRASCGYGNKGWNTASETLKVNLASTVKVTLPFFNATGEFSDQTFSLPPLTLLFKATSDEIVEDPLTINLEGYPGASNFTIVRRGTTQFAGVRVRIPEWLSVEYSLFETGIVSWHNTDTYNPPPP
jgi:hypothetical protein